MFRVVHRSISVKHQFTIGFAIVRIERNANAQGDHQFIRIEMERAINDATSEFASEAASSGGGFGQQDEFIPTDTRQRVLAFQLQIMANAESPLPEACHRHHDHRHR